MTLMGEDFRLPTYDGTEPCVNDWDLFYGPSEHQETHAGRLEREAIAVAACGGCHMIHACAAWGIMHERYGVWGGLTETDRGAIRARHGLKLMTPEANTAEKDRAIIRARRARGL